MASVGYAATAKPREHLNLKVSFALDSRQTRRLSIGSTTECCSWLHPRKVSAERIDRFGRWPLESSIAAD
jgi:hypothetical protein